MQEDANGFQMLECRLQSNNIQKFSRIFVHLKRMFAFCLTTFAKTGILKNRKKESSQPRLGAGQK